MKIAIDKEYERKADAVRETDGYKVARVVSDFTERIWARMEDAEITQSELARRLGVGRSRVAKILDGSTNFTFETAVRISSALEMDFEACLVSKYADNRFGCGRISVGFVEGVLSAKTNSSWRRAVSAPSCRQAEANVGKDKEAVHGYPAVAVG